MASKKKSTPKKVAPKPVAKVPEKKPAMTTAPKQVVVTQQNIPKVNMKPVTHASLNQALFAFQGEDIVIPRNGQGKTTDSRTYKYATLDDTLKVIKPFLQKHGLMIAQPMTGNMLVTKIVHIDSKEEMVSELELGKPERTQDLGTRITYLRRYQVVSMLNLTIEDDLDSKSASELPPANIAPEKTFEEHSKEAHGEKVADVVQKKEETPTEEKVSETPVTDRMNAISHSDNYIKAQKAIQTCNTGAALEIIKGQINRSSRLTDEEKSELLVLAEKRAAEIPQG